MSGLGNTLRGAGEGLDSLFVAAARALEAGSAGAAPRSDPAGAGLFDEAPMGPASPEPTAAEAERAAGFVRCRSALLFDLCLRAWMSEEGVGAELLRTAAEVGLEGEEVADDCARPHVRLLRAACRRVDREICRLHGLARFAPRADGLYSAPMEPDHNVLAALVPHFSRRFGREDFALVDLRRGLAFEARSGIVEARTGADALALLPDPGTGEEEALWRRYFEAAENPLRRNAALQRRLMPARYWKYLPELAGQGSGTGPAATRAAVFRRGRDGATLGPS